MLGPSRDPTEPVGKEEDGCVCCAGPGRGLSEEPSPLSGLHRHCRLCPRLSSSLWALDLLPAAAVANDHKLSSFKQQNLISHCSGSQKSRIKMWQSHTPS